MAYFYENGNGIDSNAYIYVQLQVTRTDYPTYSRFSVKSVAVSDTGTSSFIRGQVTTNQAGNSWTAATGWKDVSYNGTTTLATATFDVARGASDKTARIGAYAEGGGTGIYSGGTDYAWLNVTVPKVLSPNAPTGCTATYVSDSQATVAWTNGTADTDHPRDATLVERRDGSNEWAQVASASGTASGYTDNGISANTQYQYRVRAKNVAGYSAYSTSGSIYTTPAAPTSVTLDKTAATTVQVDVTGTWGYAVTYDVGLTYDGGATWSTVATSTSLPYSATVSGGTVQFRVRATRGALASAWTLSASIVTITPPLAPTIVQAPANPTAYGDSSVISWTPNHPDGSTQSAAEVKVTNPGGTSTTYSVTTATSYTLATNATGTWTAQVRTKGLDPSYGEWSQTVSWGVHNPPAVVITSPATDGTDVVALPLNVAWTVTDPTGVSTQRIIIEGDGQILNRTLAGDVRTVALNASDVALENGQTYTIRLRVMGGSGLVTEQTRIFDVAWLAPTPPVLQITEGEGRSATIDVMDTRYTSSGTVLEASSSMMESLTIQGLSVQDGTPTPSAPVAIKSVQGRNLASVSSLAFDAGNTTICDLGQDMTFDSIIVAFDADNLAYTVSGGAVIDFRTDGGAHSYVSANNLLSYFVVDSAINGKVFYRKVSATFRYIDLYARSDAFAKFASGTFENIQVVAGNTLTPYVESGSIGVWPHGANLIQARDLSKSSSAAYYFELNVSGGTRLPPFGLEEGVTYTFSADVVSSVEPFGISVGAGNGSYMADIAAETNLTNGRVSISFTPTASNFTYGNILALRAPRYSSSTTFSCTVSNIQLEIGSPATAYEPYSSTTTPIPVTLRSLPDGTHDEWVSGDEVDTLVQRAGVQVFDGSESWTAYNSGGSIGYIFYTNLPDAEASQTRTTLLCSHCVGATAVSPTRDMVTIGTTKNAVFGFGTTLGISTAAAWKTWLASNPITLIYKLATPITTTYPHVDLPYVDGSAWVDAEVTPNIEATFRPVDFPDQPTIQSVDVQRVNADGTAWTVATGLTVGGSCIDPLPPLGVPVTYRATSSAASGSTASGEFTETFGGRDWVLNFGNAAQEHIGFVYNPQADLSLKQGGTPYHFADGGAGKGLPVFYPTTDRDYAGTLKFDTILYGDTDKVLDLCDRYPVAWLRDPFGHRWRAQVSPSVSHGVGQVWPVTLSWDAMRFEEAWDG